MDTIDLESLLKEALVQLVSEESKERLTKLCRNILNELQSEYELTINNGNNQNQYTIQELEQMSIENLEKLNQELKINVETKKDELFNQLTIRKRLENRLIKIYEIIERNKLDIQTILDDHLNNLNQNQLTNTLLDDYVNNWNCEKKKINSKFEFIYQLLDQLNIK